MSQPNRIQKAIGWMLHKAVGFPVWNFASNGYSGQLRGFYSEPGALGGQNPMALAAYYGCVRVICRTMGSLPLHVYRETKSGGRERAVDHPTYQILNISPNRYMTSMEWREAVFYGHSLRGNGYTLKQMIGKRIVSLNPLNPDKVLPKFENGALTYQVLSDSGATQVFQPEEILHYKNFSVDGINGLTPLRREIVQRGLDAQMYASKFFQNSGRPGGAIKFPPGPIKPETLARLRTELDTIHQGPENAGRTLLLADGGEWQSISISPEEAQFIQTMQLVAADFSAIFGVPLNMLGQSDKTATYASAEQFDIQFVKHAIRPLCVAFEQMLKKSLYMDEPGIFAEFDLDALQRGDSVAQATAAASDVQNGIRTRDERRKDLGLAAQGGLAAELTVQSNLVPLNKLGQLPASAPNQPPGKEPNAKN